jgi:hypothetical protein
MLLYDGVKTRGLTDYWSPADDAATPPERW